MDFKVGDHLRVKPGYTLVAANSEGLKNPYDYRITGNEIGTVTVVSTRPFHGECRLQFTRGRYINLPSNGKLLPEADESLVLVKAGVKK